MLETQLYMGQNRIGMYSPDRIRPVQNYFVKPYGGLWTSTYDMEFKSRWVQFCETDATILAPESGEWAGYLITPRRDARIITIDTYEDLERLTAKYPFDPYHGALPGFMNNQYLDFESIAKEYDGIHLTHAGQWRTRLSNPLNLYGWDVESTLWFRDCFHKMMPIRFKSSITKQKHAKLVDDMNNFTSRENMEKVNTEFEKLLFEALGIKP